jgi:hypothetical protein
LNIDDAIIFPERAELHREKLSALGDFSLSGVKKRRGISPRGLFWTFYRPLRRMLLWLPYGVTLRHNYPL